MDTTDKGLLTEAGKVNEMSLRVRLLLFIIKNTYVGALVAIVISYVSVSAIGYICELIFKESSYKTLAVVSEYLFIFSAAYAVCLQLLVRKLAK